MTEVKQATRVLKVYKELLFSGNRESSLILDLCKELCPALLKWLGETYVGKRKSTVEESAYQQFFEAFYDLLSCALSSKLQLYELEQEWFKSLVYTGNLYRYLGKSDPFNRDRVSPQYNKIYVSWSKGKENSYLRSKLYGPKTQLSCNVQLPYFGIDIEGFTMYYHKHINSDILIARGTEREVVFPTIQECIYSVKYIEDGIDE